MVIFVLCTWVVGGALVAFTVGRAVCLADAAEAWVAPTSGREPRPHWSGENLDVLRSAA